MVSTDCLHLHYHLDEIATKVAYDCTVTKSDCTVVIEALIHEMNNQLTAELLLRKARRARDFQSYHQIKGAIEASEFSAAINIYGWAIKILPAYGVDAVGLSKTKCIIRKVSKDEAAKTRKPCGYCYGYIRRGKDLDRDSTYIAR